MAGPLAIRQSKTILVRLAMPNDVSVELIAVHCYIVVADFRTRADAIEAVKQVIAEVTAPSLVEEGCQIYHWSQGADDPMLFLLYMEWRENRVLKRTLPHRTSSTPKIV
ncbi:MAG: putative quinol monooxygenase [Nitrospirota bacterium]